MLVSSSRVDGLHEEAPRCLHARSKAYASIAFVMLATMLFIQSLPMGVRADPVYLFVGESSERLRSGGSDDPRPPILLLPGLCSTRLISWKKKSCRGPDINVMDIVWLNLQKMLETGTFDKNCWIDCIKLGANGSDPLDCKIRADEGLSAIGELSPGNLYTPPSTSIFSSLIKMLAHELGYDSRNIIAAPYDWRLAPCELQERDSFFTSLKFRLETTVKRHKRPAIVIAHSMGTNLFLYFCDWLRYVEKPSMGWREWLRRHVWGYVGFAAPLLGAPGSIKSVMSGHTFGLTISEAQARELQLTFSSTHFLNPRSTKNLNNANRPSSRSNFTFDYADAIITIKSASGGSQVSFGIEDVENGELFRWAGNMFKERLLLDKYETLLALYLKDPLKPLSRLARRPPVRHCLMVYGVGLPTEVGYTYRIAEGNNPIGAPILDEVLLEQEVCRKRKNKQPHEDSDQSCSAAVSTYLDVSPTSVATETCETDDISGLSSTTIIINNNSNSGSGDSSSGSGDSSDDIHADVDNKELQALAKKINGAVVEDRQQKSRRSDKCHVEVFARSNKKSALGSNKKRFVRRGAQNKTGDVTVPYISLSFAKTWLEAEGNERWEEYKPQRAHRSFDGWLPESMANSLSTVVDPAVEIFHSKSKNGDTTVVMEVQGVDHLEITKHSYVLSLTLEHLLVKMRDELKLNESKHDGKPYDERSNVFFDSVRSMLDKLRKHLPGVPFFT